MKTKTAKSKIIILTWVWAMMRITLQYFFILLKSRSIDFLPASSCHFLMYLVKAFFLERDLYTTNHGLITSRLVSGDELTNTLSSSASGREEQWCKPVIRPKTTETLLQPVSKSNGKMFNLMFTLTILLQINFKSSSLLQFMYQKCGNFI